MCQFGVGPFYRGWLVTRELSNSQDLWTALQGDFIVQAGLPATLKAVADTVCALHHQGVYHCDLNLKNILVRMEAKGVAGYVIDFDKARLYLGKLPAELVKRNLDKCSVPSRNSILRGNIFPNRRGMIF